LRKPQKPLTYLVHPILMDTPEIKERVDKGHTVITLDQALADVDEIIGPNCFRISPETAHLLDVTDKAARNVKYPPKAKANAKG
jgi:hypothetical protein